MRTVTFRSVLYGVATRMGLEPEQNLQLNQATALSEYISDRLAKAWEIFDWPEWTTSEVRLFRAPWRSVTTYTLGDEVYYADQNAYYRSIVAADNLDHPPTDTFWWAPLSGAELEAFIPFDQAWEPVSIHLVWNVWMDDPLAIDRPRPLSWWLTPEGIRVQTSGTKVYVEFGLKPPRFTTRSWEATTNYVAGDLVYYDATGDCYEARLASTNLDPPNYPASWKLQAFPQVLARHVKLAAIGDALREDENPNKAVAWDVQAELELGDAWDRAQNQMRAPHTFSVRGR